MKSKIAILLMPFIHSFFFKENLMKTIIAMFNLNRKSTFRTTSCWPSSWEEQASWASPAWAAEIDCGFSSEAAKNAGPQYGGSITFLDGYGGAQQPTAWHKGEGSSVDDSLFIMNRCMRPFWHA